MLPQLWVPTYFFLLSALNDLIEQNPSSAEPNILKGIYVAAFQSGSPAPNVASTLTTQTECTYDGYARQAVVWFPPYIDPALPVALTAANVMFRPTDAVVPNLVTQIGLVTALTGGVLLLLAQLQTPISLANPLTAFTTAPVVQLPTTSVYGGPLVWA